MGVKLSNVLPVIPGRLEKGTLITRLGSKEYTDFIPKLADYSFPEQHYIFSDNDRLRAVFTDTEKNLKLVIRWTGIHTLIRLSDNMLIRHFVASERQAPVKGFFGTTGIFMNPQKPIEAKYPVVAYTIDDEAYLLVVSAKSFGYSFSIQEDETLAKLIKINDANKTGDGQFCLSDKNVLYYRYPMFLASEEWIKLDGIHIPRLTSVYRD